MLPDTVVSAGGGQAPVPAVPPRPRADGASGAAPISGGTLLISRDGALAVVADPDRDRVSVVDLVAAQVMATVALKSGDEPGRLAEDDDHRIHVVLRNAGQLATIALDSQQLVARRDVCSAPQGVAYEHASGLLHVACGDGQLVSLPADGGEVTRRVHVDSDLRDVLISNGRIFVSRFKHAELLRLDAQAGVLSRARPELIKGPFMSPSLPSVGAAAKSFDAAVAWRTVQAADGSFVMVHQRAQVDAITLHAAGEGQPVPIPAGNEADGGFDIAPAPVFGAGGGAYGSGFGCDSIVESQITYLSDAGDHPTDGPMVPGMVLPVDAAVSHDGHWLAVASAGSFQSRNGRSESFGAVVMPMGLKPLRSAPKAAGTAAVLPAAGPFADTDGGVELPPSPPVQGVGQCLMPGRDAPGMQIAPGQVVALAFDMQDRLVMLTRDPNRLRVMNVGAAGGCTGCEHYVLDIDLGGAPRRTTGHDLFHANAGGGLACASCHPQGADDGHTWNFAGLGPRRTQLFNMGITDTLPLHWDGEFKNLNELLLDVFVQRMGGGELALSDAEALSDYLDTLHPNTPMRSSKDAAARRGKTLFESAEVGCNTCHSGAKFTNNKSVDVGTGGSFQVPSLIGVAYHQPYLHNGCAQTLRDRFERACGGSAHGHTEQLAAGQIDDLVAYLESL